MRRRAGPRGSMMAPDFGVVAAAVGLPFGVAALAPGLYRLLGDRTGHAGAVRSPSNR